MLAFLARIRFLFRTDFSLNQAAAVSLIDLLFVSRGTFFYPFAVHKSVAAKFIVVIILIPEELWCALVLIVGDFIKDAPVSIILLGIEQVMYLFKQVVLLIFKSVYSLEIGFARETLPIVQRRHHVRDKVFFLLDDLIFLDHVVELELAERLDKGALVSMECELGEEVGHSNRLKVIADVYLFAHSVTSLFVAFIVVTSALPPETFLPD